MNDQEHEYEIQGNYGYGYGYETVMAEQSLVEAKQRLKEYRENEPGIPFRIRKVKDDTREQVGGFIRR